MKAIFPIAVGLLSALSINNPSSAQQWVVVNKDNTRPETRRQFNQQNTALRVGTITAERFNGYNDIQWTALADQGTSKFIVEYSWDGVNFETAGQVVSLNGQYNLKHYTLDTRPVLYRLRTENINGPATFSQAILLDGLAVPAVKIYPTNITGNIINVNAGLPLERVVVTSIEGQQMYAKELNGSMNLITVNIPSLQHGLYIVTFYGNGWKTSSKITIG
jgi:hypothetical protein